MLTPTNGTSDCSESISGVGDTCTVTCDTGYELAGDSVRTCQSNRTWSGTAAVCRSGMK